jgi:hypothetical protein
VVNVARQAYEARRAAAAAVASGRGVGHRHVEER